MYPTSQPSPSCPLPPPSRQNKALSQKEYREKEGESFNMLRDVIRILTGEELRTRLEILNKAIDLLSSLREIRSQSEGQSATLTLPAHEAPASSLEPEDAALLHLVSLSISHPSQTPHQTLASNAQFDAATFRHGAHFYDLQHYHLMPAMDSNFDLWSSPGYRGESSNHR